jgi:predicted dinucleotide-binding enzyme
MKVGMIGTGNMGSTLGRLWAGCGQDVFFGSRDPQRGKALAAEVGRGAQGGSIEQASAFGDVLALAVPWHAAQETVRIMLPLDGKVLIDMINAFEMDSGPLLGFTTSAAEQIASWAPGARVVKAFNSIHFASIANPDFGGQAASQFYCGDDLNAKAQVARLSTDIGLDPVDAGPLWMARQLEPLAFIWIYLAWGQNLGTDTALKLLRRPVS